MSKFIHTIFSELIAHDALLVMARGLGLETIMYRLLSLYSSERHPILLLNMMQEANILTELLLSDGYTSDQLPVMVTNEMSASERITAYKRGGVVFITARICVVDMLTHRLQAEHVGGIIVGKAHLVNDTSAEAFILRIFRQQNKTGLVKALTDDAEALGSGFNRLEKLMRSLHLRKILLWPRFHVLVHDELDRNAPDVLEISLSLTEYQRGIQTAVIAAMDACFQELKKHVPVDVVELTIENNLFEAFDTHIRRQLDSIWNKLSVHVKQLVSDLKTLRKLLVYMLRYDAVTFYEFLDSIRFASANGLSPSTWLMTDAAENLFMCARSRLYRISATKRGSDSKGASASLKLLLEQNPKWRVLLEIIEETKTHTRAMVNNKLDTNVAHPGCRVVIFTRDKGTARQLHELICRGSQALLQRKWISWLRQNWARTAVLRQMVENEASNGLSVSPEQAALWNNAREFGLDTQDYCISNTVEERHKSDMALTVTSLPDPHVTIHPLSSDTPAAFILNDLRPMFIIVYDPEPAIMRQIEVYKALYMRGSPVRVYFLLYKSSMEEQKYLTSLKKEQAAFEKLIHAKSHMAVPENASCGESVLLQHQNDSTTARRSGASRKGLYDESEIWQDMTLDVFNYSCNNSLASSSRSELKGLLRTTGIKDQGKRKVIIDMREFRSKLPVLLHQSGMEITPVTLEIGDYIISKDICIERKSVADLIGSLGSGRLYNQATAMSRAYPIPTLLVEWDATQTFGFTTSANIPAEIKPSHIQSRLVLLTMAFPNLRVLWTRSPHSTVELFMSLKQRQPEPELSTAMSLGTDYNHAVMPNNDAGTAAQAEDQSQHETNGETGSDNSQNTSAIDVLRKFPGITQVNITQVIGAVDSIVELCTMSLFQLEQLLGANNAYKLHRFLHNIGNVGI